MTLFLFIFCALIISPVQAQSISSKTVQTVCNLRYNNRGIIYADIPCKAEFINQRLRSVSLVFPSNKIRYNWTVGQPEVTADPRWYECMRHTASSGNQWQICTVPSPTELGL